MTAELTTIGQLAHSQASDSNQNGHFDEVLAGVGERI
jgi:hypothetical protein